MSCSHYFQCAQFFLEFRTLKAFFCPNILAPGECNIVGSSLQLTWWGSVLQVDIVDFNGSFLTRVRDLIGSNPIILVATKVLFYTWSVCIVRILGSNSTQISINACCRGVAELSN